MKKLIIRVAILAVIVGVGIWLFVAIKNRDISINDFFVGNYQKGVDVSLYQENVDFERLKEQHIDFVYIKATEGSTHIDNSFGKKWDDAKKAGILSGAYHYFSYYQSGVAQAENFIKTVGDLNGHLIPAIDMELTVEEIYNPPEKDTVVRGLKACVAILEEKYKDTLEGKLGLIMGEDLLPDFHLWNRAEEIAQRCTLIVARRPYKQESALFANKNVGDYGKTNQLEFDITKEPLFNNCVAIENPLLTISSTDIRERISCGKSFEYLVPRPVFRYIIDGKLYGHR